MMRRGRILAACAFAVAACGRPAPPQAAAPKLEAAVRAARDTGPCRSVVAQEWPAGWPVPLDGANGRRFKIFFYPLSGAPGTSPRLATPSAEAVVDADAGAPIECNILPGFPKDVLAPRWTPEAHQLTAAEFDSKSAELDRLTEEVAAVYAARRTPTAADVDLTRRYLAAFETMAEPPFLEYYYRLNPAFWEWVRAVAGRSIRG
ncbi:MAG: hypothetical protein ACHQ2Z_06925 [Elusimicrobiota bacterium]